MANKREHVKRSKLERVEFFSVMLDMLRSSRNYVPHVERLVLTSIAEDLLAEAEEMSDGV